MKDIRTTEELMLMSEYVKIQELDTQTMILFKVNEHLLSASQKQSYKNRTDITLNTMDVILDKIGEIRKAK